MTEYGVVSKGFVSKTYTEILGSLRDKSKELFGDDIDLSDTSPLLKILQNVALELYIRWQAMEGVYYSAFVETAIGSSLDQIAALFNLTRQTAIRSSGTITFSGSEPFDRDIRIPEETSMSTGPYNDPYVVFKTTEEVVLPSGVMSINASIASVGYGEDQNVVSHTLTELIDSPSGVTLLVDNADPTVSGADKETDAHFRIRTMGHVLTLGKGTLSAIENSVLGLTGVIDVLATEDTAEHSVHLVVKGGDDTEITNKIEETRPAGIFADWERPTEIIFTVDCTVTRLSTYPEDVVKVNVETAIVDWLTTRKISEDLDFSKLLREIVNAEGIDEVDYLTVTGASGTMNKLGDMIVMDPNEIAVSGTITVVVS